MLFAVLLGLLYFDYFIGDAGLWLKIAFAATLIFGALLPDIDQQESSASHKMPILSGFVRLFSRHRGIMHSIWIPIVLFLIAKFVVVKFFNLPDMMLMGFLIGYASHLLADSFTVQGIEPFTPFSRFRARGWMRTGGIVEAVIGILIVSFLIIR